MGRIPVVTCPKCDEGTLRRIYLQNSARSDRPRHEPIQGWLYCEACNTMHGRDT